MSYRCPVCNKFRSNKNKNGTMCKQCHSKLNTNACEFCGEEIESVSMIEINVGNQKLELNNFKRCCINCASDKKVILKLIKRLIN